MIAYPPEALSSVACTTSPRKGIGTECSTKALDYTQIQQLPFVLAFPPEYTLIDPGWKLSCGNSRLGLHDPPWTLNKVPYLVDPTLVGTQTPTAAPGGKPSPGPIAATPTPTVTSGEKAPARLPTMSPGLRGSDPPAAPDLKSAAISNIMSNLPFGGNQQQSPPYDDKPDSSDSKGAGDPHRALGNSEEHSESNSSNDPEDFRGGSTKSPAKDDPPLPSLRGNKIQEAYGGGVVIGSTVLHPGDQTAQAGTSVSVGNAFIVVGGSMIHLAAPTRGVSDLNRLSEPTLNSVNIDDYTPVVAFTGGDITSGSANSPGAQSRTFGTAVSDGSYNIIAAGAIHAFLPQGSRNPVVIAGQTVTKASNNGVIAGNSTYPSGAQATLSGTVLSVGTDNVVLGSSTYALPSNPTDEPTFVDCNTITRAPDGRVIIGDFTVAPGGQKTFSSHKISLGVSSVMIDGSTFALPTSAGSIAYQNLGSKSITLANEVVISAGGPAAIISGTTYHIPADDGGLIINDKTTGFPTRLQSVFTIAGQTFVADPTGFEANRHSISSDGSAVTLSGTVVSLRSLGLPMIGSLTVPLAPAQETHNVGLIMTGSSAANFSRPLAFAGGSVRLRDEMQVVLLAVFGLSVGAVACVL